MLFLKLVCFAFFPLTVLLFEQVRVAWLLYYSIINLFLSLCHDGKHEQWHKEGLHDGNILIKVQLVTSISFRTFTNKRLALVCRRTLFIFPVLLYVSAALAYTISFSIYSHHIFQPLFSFVSIFI